MSKAYKQAIINQAKAAMPDKSVFVAANAGSGKTKVLVDRVSRLLLAGSEPDKILCLTYTKAAAAEMQTRLFETLGGWSVMNEASLKAELNKLTNKSQDIKRARSLFARALETPGGLKVQTIHAFCEKILRRFPLEAGISPNMEALDEQAQKSLLKHIVFEIETSAAQNQKSKIAEAIILLSQTHETLDRVYDFAIKNSWDILNWHKAGGIKQLAARLNINPNKTEQDLLREFFQKLNLQKLKTAATEMMASGKKNKARGAKIAQTIEQIKAGNKNYSDLIDNYKGAFLTQKGGIFSKPVYGTDCTFAMQIIPDEADRVYNLYDAIYALNTYHQTKAAYYICHKTAEIYEKKKKHLRVLDFNDQIRLAANLLVNSDAREWVRYKLDGGVDHILLDEAQDTSDLQWEIIKALSDEFFQTGANTKPRTLFAVGDEKQSIYRFQGAKPELFLRQLHELSKKQSNTPEVFMNMSFRSCGEVLQLVDCIFYNEQKAIRSALDYDKYPPASDIEGHEAYRTDGGLVELWPLSRPADKSDIDEKPDIAKPVDAPDMDSAPEKLAKAIATKIKQWLDEGEPVNIRQGKNIITRPMLPSDILILVQSRSAFFYALIRNLKSFGVPVAGADRLELTNHIAVQDLLSLAKFVLLPADDLALAEVLKSPLFGWDDKKLEDIAFGRKSSLWQAMPDSNDKDILAQIIKLSTTHAPYEFFARSLAIMDEKKSLLQKIYDRLGVEAVEIIEVFLARALAYQRSNPPSLQKFIADISSSDETIKREQDNNEQGAGEVRVMSVHGAKGLEAPVVILPDTIRKPSDKMPVLLQDGDFMVKSASKKQRPTVLSDIYENELLEDEREYLRLLYVALTRAESRLLICGKTIYNNGKIAENSWYERILLAMKSLKASEFKTDFDYEHTDKKKKTSTKYTGLRYGSAPILENKTSQKQSDDNQTQILPDWVYETTGKTKEKAKYLSPSQLGKSDESLFINSPLRENTDDLRFMRGNLIHKLLEILPDIPVEQREAKTLEYLASNGIKNDMASKWFEEINLILQDEKFKHIFAPNSAAEINIAGGAGLLPKGILLSGQIDRLVVGKDHVWIIDYKSNKNPPKNIGEIPEIYLNQMAAYSALISEIYPDREIKCALLWTETPELMQIPTEIIKNINLKSVVSA